MSEIPEDDVCALLLRTVPETAPFIVDMYDVPAEQAVLTNDMMLDLYPVLLDCFTTPVHMPQLRSPDPDSELLARCWDFVEQVVSHSSMHVSGAVYFQVLEQLMDDLALVRNAWPHMQEQTRECTLAMLSDFGTSVRGITS